MERTKILSMNVENLHFFILIIFRISVKEHAKTVWLIMQES